MSLKGTLFGSGDNKTTKTESYTANPYATNALTYAESLARGLPGAGDVPLQGTEGFSQDQLNAQQDVRDAQGIYDPYAQRAAALNAQFGQGLDPGRVQDMYAQLSAGPLEQLWAQQRAEMAKATRGGVGNAGGTGASRVGVAQGNIANQQSLATGKIQSDFLTQAIQAELAAQSNRGAAAAQEANLGMGHTGQLYNDASQLWNSGAATQGLGQAELNARFQRQRDQYQNPYTNYSAYASLLPQYANIYKGTTTTEQEVPQQGLFQTLAGAAGSALGSYFGGKMGKPAADGGRIEGYAPGGTVGWGGGNPGGFNPYAAMMRARQQQRRPSTPDGGGLFNRMVSQYFPQQPQQQPQTPSPFATALQGLNNGVATPQEAPQDGAAQAATWTNPTATLPPKDPFTQPQPVDQINSGAGTPTQNWTNPFGSALQGAASPMVTGQPALGLPNNWTNPSGTLMSGGGAVRGYYDGGEASNEIDDELFRQEGVDKLRDLFSSPAGQSRLNDMRSIGEEPPSLPAPIEVPKKPFNHSDEQVISIAKSGDPDSKFDAIRANAEDSGAPVNPYSNPSIARVNLENDEDDGVAAPRSMSAIRLPSMPDTGFKAPERSPWGSVIAAAAKGAMAMNKRLPSGHLANYGGGGLGAGIAEGVLAGEDVKSAHREEDRKNYDKKLAGERLAETAAMARLPYLEQTLNQQVTSDQKQREIELKEATPVAYKRDLWGRPIYGIRDPKTRQILDTSTGKPISQTPTEDTTDETVLRPLAEKIARYELQAPSTRVITPATAKLWDMVRTLNPSYDDKHYAEAKKTILSFSGDGQRARTVTAFNTALDHMATLEDIAKDLNNPSSVVPLNRIYQAVTGATGSVPPVAFDAVKSIVGAEISKSVIGGQFALQDREEVRAALDRANTPDQLKAVIRRMKELMVGQLRSQDRAYQAGTGGMTNFADKYLTAGAQKAYKMTVNPAEGGMEPQGGESGTKPKLSKEERSRLEEFIKKNPKDPKALQAKKLLGE